MLSSDFAASLRFRVALGRGVDEGKPTMVEFVYTPSEVNAHPQVAYIKRDSLKASSNAPLSSPSLDMDPAQHLEPLWSSRQYHLPDRRSVVDSSVRLNMGNFNETTV